MKRPSALLLRRIAVILGFVGCFVVIVVLGFRVLDAALEIDNLKTGGDYIFKRMDDLLVITNASFRSCNMKVQEFERVVKDAGIPMNSWAGETTLVGSFKVTRQGNCVTRIEFSR